MEFLAKTFAGLEDLLAGELKSLGATQVETEPRLVRFAGNKELLYNANYRCRTALRFLAPLFNFEAHTDLKLYNGIRSIDWSEWIDPGKTFAIDTTVNSSVFRHSHYAGLKAKDAIADQFRDKTGLRPSVDVDNPDLRINLHIYETSCSVSIDTSGESLHRRSYRMGTREAPINEVLAAGMVLLTGWTGDKVFTDPMCGSGTILIEAAMIAANIPPLNKRRNFGFQTLPNYDARLWEKVRKEADAATRLPAFPILGFDQDPRALHTAEKNIFAAGLEKYVTLERAKFETLVPPQGPGVAVFNPPYEERLVTGRINELYKSIGDRLKQAFSNYEAWIISSNMEALKNIGLRPSRKINLFNGPLGCKFQRYDLYDGTKKIHKTGPKEEIL